MSARTCLAFLLLTIVNIAGLQGQVLKIRIQPVFNKAPLVLEKQEYRTSNNDALRISTCKFYLSHITLNFTDGSTYIEPDSYHLVDVSDSTSLLLNLKSVPAKEITAITFSIGVDSVMSVSGAHGGDLDPRHGMYWSWNSGYINAKLEGASPSSRDARKRFEFHIGGYSGSDNAIRSVNFVCHLTDRTNTITLQADIARWFDDISLSEIDAVMSPGPRAQRIAANYARMFSLVTP